jgi:hypothetical protein
VRALAASIEPPPLTRLVASLLADLSPAGRGKRPPQPPESSLTLLHF